MADLPFVIDWEGPWRRRGDGTLEAVPAGRVTLRLRDTGPHVWQLVVPGDVQAALTEEMRLLAASFPPGWLRLKATAGPAAELFRAGQPGPDVYTGRVLRGAGTPENPVVIRFRPPDLREALPVLPPAVAGRLRLPRRAAVGRPPLGAAEQVVRAWVIHLEVMALMCQGKKRQAASVVVARAHGLSQGRVNSMLSKTSEYKKLCWIQRISFDSD